MMTSELQELKELKEILQNNKWKIQERVTNVTQYFTVPLNEQLLSDHPESDECETYYEASNNEYVLYDENEDELLSGTMGEIRSYLFVFGRGLLC